MAHHGNAALGQKADGVGHGRAAFQLHRCGAGIGQDTAGAFERMDGRRLVTAERHVDDDGGMKAAARDGGAMRAHHVERYGQGGGQAIDHLAERIAHQQDIAMRIEQLGGAHGIGRQHHQRFGLRIALARLDRRDGDPLHGLGRGGGAAGGAIDSIGGGHGTGL
jgi:hypothetical protein